MRKVILAALASAWLVAAAEWNHAATITPRNPVPPHTLVRVTPAAGERVWVLPWSDNPTAVDVVEAKNGDLVFVGPPGRYAVLWLSADGQGQAFVTIGSSPPGPGPAPVPPGPGPSPSPERPDGFAGEVFDKAASIADKATAGKLAAVCRDVMQAIDRGGVSRDAAAELVINGFNAIRPPAAWRPFAGWFTEQGSQRALTLPQMRTFLADCVTGLEAAAK